MDPSITSTRESIMNDACSGVEGKGERGRIRDKVNYQGSVTIINYHGHP